MSRALLLYNLLAYQDVVRLWQTVRHHVVIVAGICLPILLLLGLKNGHVAKLREDLVRSPSGRQILFVSGMKGDLLSLDALERLELETAGVEIAIPDVSRTVSLSIGEGDDARSIESVTIYATRAGDPAFGSSQPRLSPDGRDLVVMQSVADKLGADIGDPVRLTAFRRREGVDESATVEFRIAAVLASTDAGQQDTGYALVPDIIDLERYAGGYAVPRFGWPAIDAPAPDVYDSYLIFCESSDPLSESDVSTYGERGYQIVPVEDVDLRTLYGLLKPESLERLVVYRLSTGMEGGAGLSLAPGEIARNTRADDVVIPWNAPMTVEVNGTPTRLVGLSLPKRTWFRLYAEPREIGFDFDTNTFSLQQFRASPASSPARLRSESGLEFDAAVTTLALPATANETAAVTPSGIEAGEEGSATDAALSEEAPSSATDATESTKVVTESESGADAPKPVGSEAADLSPPAKTSGVEVPIVDRSGGGARVVKEVSDLSTEADAVADADAPESEAVPGAPSDASSSTGPGASVPSIVVGPAYLLAYLHSERRGVLQYDPARGIFTPTPTEPVFGKVRLYAETIDDVPSVVASLRERNFSCLSEIGLIEEIQSQDRSLQILVAVVGIGVFLMGIVTVVSVLSDSTDRKRGSIGILRVMGVSRFGIFYMVFARAAAIGVMAAAVTIAVGFAVAVALAWEPDSPQWLARWKPVIAIEFRPEDVAFIVGGSLLCCVLGSILPARRASRMEPFEAIVDGRFR